MSRIHAAHKFLAAIQATGAKAPVMTLEVHEPEWLEWQKDAHRQKNLVYDLRRDAIVLVTGTVVNEARLYVMLKRSHE